MRSPSRRRVSSWFRPHVLPLEGRLPLGDGFLGLLVGASLLPPEAATCAAVAPPSSERGVSTPRLDAVTEGFTPPARPAEGAFAAPFAEGDSAAPKWDAVATAFAPSARRQPGTLTSPQREQEADAQPLLAPRAGETGVTVHLPTPPPVFVSPRPAADALLATLAALQPSAPPTTLSATPTQKAAVKENFGKLPLTFEQNVGQTDASVQFFTRGPGYGLYLTSTEAVMVLNQPTSAVSAWRAGDVSPPSTHAPRSPEFFPRGADAPRSPETPPAVVRLQLIGANATPAVTGRDELPGKVSYFLGNDPAQWHTNISTFARVEYDEVYPGIDLVWYGSQQQLEYDFVVAPGADPSTIRLNVSGAERLELDTAGDLLIHAGEPGGVSPGSTLRQHKPFVYQTVGSTRQEVASRFVLEGQQVRFDVAAYDAARPLVIDPVLSYSTYLGGSDREYGRALAVDPASGDVLLTGDTFSTDFPTANPLQATHGGRYDAFVARLNAAGSALVFSTYLGGNGDDPSLAVTVDPASGDVLLTGGTDSPNFPTANPLQATHGGRYDAFVARLNAAGSALVFSTYLGGGLNDSATGLAVDPASGDILLTGETQSFNFPTANPLQAVHRGNGDVFVTRLNASGSALVFSTYLGGTFQDSGRAVTVDPASGDALLTGFTASTNFPTANALQVSNGGRYDAFVVRLNAAGSALVFSTYLGGSEDDPSQALAVDAASGDALLTGYTLSFNFPTANPLQATKRGDRDVFVTKLNAAGSALVYSTYLGGSGVDTGNALAVDPASGDALLTGYTLSPDFPTAHPLQASNRGGFDGFVTRLNAAGSALVYSTYLGGSDYDGGAGIAVDPASGDALLMGGTFSTDFPTANPLQAGNRGNGDVFVTRISPSPAAYYYVYPDSGQVRAGVPFDFYVFALDAQFSLIPDYTGLILFYATDPLATTPVYHQFERPNPGYAYFPSGLTFNTPGVQELYVFDYPGIEVFGYAAFQVV